ncbi:isoleucine--tRNA ligase [archaeon]|jgi:isoleucyl-tRNA synthetase|nr:isoleucine--tRNA ligase [archaeon]MBT4648336.1 isoleucine--tRNA ligase [archaeon]MBT6822325.1 isoleucine--tRNA ligase [archaeon]MBT7392814.1 isoleucine--tRNA ligase [archaeon]
MIEKYDPVNEEKNILEFWNEKNIRQKSKDKGNNGEPFYFLDGPPYTSGKIHLGTAWNKSLKDMVTRYKRMQGFDVWDRAGYDMHGLPTEGKVQKKLELKTKEDILKFGLTKFINECRDFSVTNLLQMNKDFKRLGVWLDFDNAYQTIANEYIEGTWWLVKKAHEKKRLYEGQMTMTWCGSCQTSLAKHELEYYDVKDKSIYVKFQVKDKPNEYLVIWTTTPWTIPFNLGVMANPEVDYIKAKVGEETWILAKDLADDVIKEKAEKDYEILEELKGKDLEGLQYTHFMEDELSHHYEDIRKKSKKCHVVVMSEEYVTTEAGTGLVHMAPGSGPEDYEVGHREGIKPLNTVDETGYYSDDMGSMSKWHVKKDNEKFIEKIESYGSLVNITPVNHDYAHCWRCRNPVLYRTTTQWFFKVEDMIQNMRKVNSEKMNWIPNWAGENQFDSWLENLRDNGITRQRFWGSPLPVWKCQKCKDYVVVESRKDLESLNASHIPEDLHKPWIDDVTIPCRCGETKNRIPDIMDVWIDAGVDSWASLGFPHDDTLFKKFFPADFITEGKDQIRGWFNLLFVASMLGMDDISFKNCYMTGFINDASGRKMSKSVGNVISPNEVTDKYGADTFRYYAVGACNPGLDLNYNFDDVELKRRNLNILWNLHNFVMDLSKTIGKNPSKIDAKILDNASDEEIYMLSKINSTIKTATEKFDNYKLNEIPSIIEEAYMELSRSYIQLVREKANLGTDEEKELVLYIVYNVMMDTINMLAPIAPFISEMIYLNFKEEFGLVEESLHLYSWPKYDESKILPEIEAEYSHIKDIIQGILGARQKANIGVRWPMQTVIIESTDDSLKSAALKYKDTILSHTNIKTMDIIDKFEEAKVTVKVNYKALGPDFGADAPKIIGALTKENDTAIISKLNAGNFSVLVDGKKFELTKNHFTMEKSCPDNYKIAQISNFHVYLDTNTNHELISEGYTREIMRRVQQLRKEQNLVKTDVISLYIQAVDELKEHIIGHEETIKKKVGASSVKISTETAGDGYRVGDNGSIKGLKYNLYFNVE